MDRIAWILCRALGGDSMSGLEIPVLCSHGCCAMYLSFGNLPSMRSTVPPLVWRRCTKSQPNQTLVLVGYASANSLSVSCLGGQTRDLTLAISAQIDVHAFFNSWPAILGGSGIEHANINSVNLGIWLQQGFGLVLAAALTTQESADIASPCWGAWKDIL